MKTKKSSAVTIVALALVWTTSLRAEARPPQGAGSEPPTNYVAPYGVPLAPPVYLVNFLLLYFSRPELAAYLPAYRTQLPQELYECLFHTPENGCPYDVVAPLLSEQAADRGGSGNKDAPWPSSCDTHPRWRHLAPPQYRRPEQINEPLGGSKAARIARALGMDQDMILTDAEYECLTTTNGGSNDLSRDIINACFPDLTNSNGNASIPLSSYGLSIDELGDVRSLCAPFAPCLEGNKLFFGPLEAIAGECGFSGKLRRLETETPMKQFVDEGGACQRDWADACIAETPCPGNGGQSSNTCSPSLKNP
jgi:hypothetical protein